MAGRDTGEVFLGIIALAGAAVAGAVYLFTSKMARIAAHVPLVDFEELRTHLESKTDKKDTVTVQGTVVREENKCLKSDKGEVEGAARRVTFIRTGDMYTNLSVSFLLRDAGANTIRVLDVHTANGLDSVMQLVSSEQGYCEKVLTFGTRVWIRGCARIEADTILINPVEIRREDL